MPPAHLGAATSATAICAGSAGVRRGRLATCAVPQSQVWIVGCPAVAWAMEVVRLAAKNCGGASFRKNGPPAARPERSQWSSMRSAAFAGAPLNLPLPSSDPRWCRPRYDPARRLDWADLWATPWRHGLSEEADPSFREVPAVSETTAVAALVRGASADAGKTADLVVRLPPSLFISPQRHFGQ